MSPVMALDYSLFPPPPKSWDYRFMILGTLSACDAGGRTQGFGFAKETPISYLPQPHSHPSFRWFFEIASPVASNLVLKTNETGLTSKGFDLEPNMNGYHILSCLSYGVPGRHSTPSSGGRDSLEWPAQLESRNSGDLR